MMKENTIIPILKRSTLDPSCMDNYRAISCFSLFGKVIIHLLLRRYIDFFSTNENQYAFKKNGSCNKCTFVITEVIKYYVSNRSSPIACFLDMHKAFDRVNLTTLFAKLREVPPHALRLLFGLYTQQKARVLWNGVYSEHFLISNGVKQGGILSPILFCVYIDEIFKILERRHIGCHIGKNFFWYSHICGRYCTTMSVTYYTYYHA